MLLTELVAVVRLNGDADLLFQAAVSTLPTAPEGLAHMLADGPADATSVRRPLARLADLSLVYRFPDGSAWVHRWTAQGLAGIDDTAAHFERRTRAGRYRLWRVEHESHDLGDAIEAVRNFLAWVTSTQPWRSPTRLVDGPCRFRQSVGIAAFGERGAADPSRRSRRLRRCRRRGGPGPHRAGADGSVRFERYEVLLEAMGSLAQAEPERADYQRELSVSYNRMGDLYRRPR